MANDKASNLSSLFSSQSIIKVEFDDQINLAKLKAIPGVTSIENPNGNIYLIKSQADRDIRNDVFQLAVQENLSVITLQKEAVKLEDIFKQLTTQEIEQ